MNKLSATTVLCFLCKLLFLLSLFLVIFAFLSLPFRWEKKDKGTLARYFHLDVTFVLKFQYLEYINLIYHVLEKPIKLAHSSRSKQQQNSCMFLVYSSGFLDYHL